jgi:Domain of unknown function (DUF5047)
VHPVTDTFLAAIRGPHTVALRVDVTWPDGSTTTDLDVGDEGGNAGQVVDDATSKVRRVLKLNVADMAAWRDIVLGGAVIRPYRGVTYVDQSSELVPLGVFEVRGTSEDLSGLAAGRIAAPDRWRRIQRARFYVPETSRPQTVAAEWARLVLEGMGDTGVGVYDLSGSSTACPGTVWPRDRDAAAEGLAESIGCEGYFNANGDAELRPVPDVTGPAVWMVDAGDNGVLIGGTADRTDERTYSAVVVVPSRADGSAPFQPVVVEDLDPSSPTFAGGPFGRVPRFYASPTIADADQARVAGEALLRRARGSAASVALVSIVNAALRSGDVIAAAYPDGRTEHHVVDALTVPLDVTAAMPIATRSSVVLPDEAA